MSLLAAAQAGVAGRLPGISVARSLGMLADPVVRDWVRPVAEARLTVARA